MVKYNPENERLKKDYLQYMGESKSKDGKTVAAIASALHRYELFNRFRSFAKFDRRSAIAFKSHVETLTDRTGKPLALSTRVAILKAVQAFFAWLAFLPGYKSKIHAPDVTFFNVSDNDRRAAKTPALRKFPSIENVLAAIRLMPAATDIDLRDRALIALTMLTGIRDNALISLKLKHLDLSNQRVVQDPKEIKTKRSKFILSDFLPIGEPGESELKAVVVAYVDHLRTVLHFGEMDPVFPKTRNEQDANQCFAVAGLSREHWQTTQSVRTVFKAAFQRAGLPYYVPHSLRHTLTHLMMSRALTLEQIKAWSMSLGHEHIDTTVTSYGHMSPNRQSDVIKGLNAENPRAPVGLDYQALAKALVAENAALGQTP